MRCFSIWLFFWLTVTAEDTKTTNPQLSLRRELHRHGGYVQNQPLGYWKDINVVTVGPDPYYDPYRTGGYGYHDQAKKVYRHKVYHYYPTERPTPVPTPRPTDHPTPPLTPRPTPRPTALPTSSPSAAPTTLRDPRTISDYICNQQSLSLLCSMIIASPPISGFLNGDPSVDLSELEGIPGYNASLFADIQQRRLQSGDRLFTMFSPNDGALGDLFESNIEELVDSRDTATIDFLNDQDSNFGEYVLGPNGRRVLDTFLLSHISDGEKPIEDLACEKTITMLNSQPSLTNCGGSGRRNRERRLQNGTSFIKYQLGLQNTFENRAEIVDADNFVRNGVVHVINGYILPSFEKVIKVPVHPTYKPVKRPKKHPTEHPTYYPTEWDTHPPTEYPSSSVEPSEVPTSTDEPSENPTTLPTIAPIFRNVQTLAPTESSAPSSLPSSSTAPSNRPSVIPSERPSYLPSNKPSDSPSTIPSGYPSYSPSDSPSDVPNDSPSGSPSAMPSNNGPTTSPSSVPSLSPTTTVLPSTSPT